MIQDKLFLLVLFNDLWYNIEPLRGICMNKRVNLYLNILEFFFFVLAMLFLYFYFKYTNIQFLLRNSFFLCGSIMGFIFIAIELFLFILMKTKTKIIYITFLLIDVVLAVLLNVKVPFIFPIIFLGLCLMKNAES